MILVMYSEYSDAIKWFKPWLPGETFTQRCAEAGRLGWSSLEVAIEYGREVIGEL